MPTLYIKTADGQHEIETRSRRISPRLRTVLILVDGKRGDEELAKMVQQADECLRSLLDAGLIKVFGTAPAAPASPAVGLPVQTGAPALTEPIEKQRGDAVRAVNDLLGPEAEALAIRLERAKNRDELRAALERAAEYIANARGADAAQKFAARFLRTLPR